MAAGSNHISRGTWMPPILLLAAALLFAAPAQGVTGQDDARERELGRGGG